MSRNLFLLLMVLSMFLFIVQCSDKSVEPNNDTNLDQDTDTTSIIHISGITYTTNGSSFGDIDASDWCYQWPFPDDPIPLDYAFYPIFPNPSFQQDMIMYDIPESTRVKIYTIDSTSSVIKDIYDKSKPAGRYWTSWDHTDNSGNAVDDGFYRLIMETDSFQCHGDIQTISTNVPDSLQMTITTTNVGNSLDILYSSEADIAGIFLIFIVRL